MECNWAQRLVSTLVRFTDNQQPRNRLVLAVLGTSRHSVATLAATGTRHSEIAPLPLDTPLVPDIQNFLRGIWGRVMLTVGGTERSCKAVENEDSVVVQLALWAGGNHRLMARMLELFGRAKAAGNQGSWQAGAAACLDFLAGKRPFRLFQRNTFLMLLNALELNNNITWSAVTRCMSAERLAEWLCADGDRQAVCSVLEALCGGMEGESLFHKLGIVEEPVKLAIIEQVCSP